MEPALLLNLAKKFTTTTGCNLTADMARSLEVARPYMDLKSYSAYKQRGSEILQKFQDQIEQLPEETSSVDEESTE